MTATLAIIGGSLAGAKAAEAAREIGFDGRLVLIGEESGAPYERPPLSKDVLRGDKPADAARVHPDDFYREHDIALITDRAVGFDTVGRTITLAGGERIAFDTAVLATGASPRRLAVPGAALDGVHYLRTVDDAVRLRDAIRVSERVAVIGAGWIGTEVAASARQMGASVVLVDPSAVPLQRVLGGEIGSVFARLHADRGVDLRLRSRLTELRGTKHVEEVVLDDGTVERADVVVVGIGVTPRTELADAAIGLRVDNGILVDDHLQTNVEGVFAAGDVANAWHPLYDQHVRVEHWATALNQGITAGHNAAGAQERYARLPYFFSDQYDVGLEYVGRAVPGDEVVVRGDTTTREFIAFWHRDGIVSAAMNVNVWDVVDDLRAIVESRTRVDPRRLADGDRALPDVL